MKNKQASCSLISTFCLQVAICSISSRKKKQVENPIMQKKDKRKKQHLLFNGCAFQKQAEAVRKHYSVCLCGELYLHLGLTQRPQWAIFLPQHLFFSSIHFMNINRRAIKAPQNGTSLCTLLPYLKVTLYNRL